MQETMEKVDAMISKYSEQLAVCGIKMTASKRYFEQRVEERIGSVGPSAILNGIDRVRYRKKEKEYNYQNNRYHCIVLTVAPTEKGIVPRGFFRDYAFVLKKIERAHIGMAPEKTAYDEQKILTEIEKRILKIVSKAQENNAEKVCKDTLWDAFRYTLPRYGYKQRFLNKDRGNWELIFLILSVVLALSVALVICLIGKLA